MRSPNFPETDKPLLATLHCPHGYTFRIYDDCPAVNAPPKPEVKLTWREKRELKRLAKRLKGEMGDDTR